MREKKNKKKPKMVRRNKEMSRIWVMEMKEIFESWRAGRLVIKLE